MNHFGSRKCFVVISIFFLIMKRSVESSSDHEPRNCRARFQSMVNACQVCFDDYYHWPSCEACNPQIASSTSQGRFQSPDRQQNQPRQVPINCPVTESALAITTTGLTCAGRDDRGWYMLDVPVQSQSSSHTIFNIKIDGKSLQIVAQTQPMRVYVNPSTSELDEWEVPKGSSIRFEVGSP